MDLNMIKSKVDTYNDIRNNTKQYRKAWNKSIKPMLKKNLKAAIKELKLDAIIEEKTEMGNLEALILNLGQEDSGISQKVGLVSRPLIRQNGMLVYQQLFNGKIIIMVIPPSVEGIGQPQPPKNIEILRPEELKSTFIPRHLDILLTTVTDWEDFDDDEPKKIGFNHGFQNPDALKNR